MPDPVDLLLITWNRRHYAEKTIANLLADPADFRLYCWDNASEDGTADLIASLDDPRIVVKHFSKKNLKQKVPCLWFFEMAESDVIGKVDDDACCRTAGATSGVPTVEQPNEFIKRLHGMLHTKKSGN